MRPCLFLIWRGQSVGKQARHIPKTVRADGFTLLETLVAIVIFSIGLMGVTAISISTVKGNTLSHHNLDASLLAQSQMETLKNEAATGFTAGADLVIGSGAAYSADNGADDVVPADLKTTSAAGVTMTIPATMFANPDHAIDSGGNPIAIFPLTPTKTPQIAWVIRNNVPFVGVKHVSIVVGWKQGGINMYTVISSILKGY